jgi:hypothetical protein
MFFVFVTRVQRDDETQPLIESFDCIFRMVFVWWTSQGRENSSMKLIRSFETGDSSAAGSMRALIADFLAGLSVVDRGFSRSL